MVKMPFEKKQPAKPVDVDKLIDRGAPVKEEVNEDEANEFFFVNLRVPKSMMKEINETVAQYHGLSRNGWMLQQFAKELKKLSNEKEK